MWFIPRLVPARRWTFVGPYAVMQLAFLLYCSLGPMHRYLNTDLMIIGIDLKGSMGSAALAALFSYISFSIGYVVSRKEVRPRLALNSNSYKHTGQLAFMVYLLALSLTLVSAGFNLGTLYNVFGSRVNDSEGASLGGLQTYFYLSMSAMIAPIVMLVLLPTPGGIMLAALMALNAIAIYVTTGFRIRIALLMLAVCLATFAKQTLVAKAGIPLLRIIQIGALGILLLTTMTIARKYGEGIDRVAISSATSDDFVAGFFKDSSIFFTGGKVISLYAENTDREHTYLEIIKATVIRAIPSQIYGIKPVPATIATIQDAMGGTTTVINSGFAAPFYIEYFIMFGWPGLIILSAILGVVCAKFENRFSGYVSLYHTLFYIMLSSYMFMYFHRGYFPQQVDFFFFFVALPMLILLPFRRSLV